MCGGGGGGVGVYGLVDGWCQLLSSLSDLITCLQVTLYRWGVGGGIESRGGGVIGG